MTVLGVVFVLLLVAAVGRFFCALVSGAFYFLMGLLVLAFFGGPL